MIHGAIPPALLFRSILGHPLCQNVAQSPTVTRARHPHTA
jgi:hypothetical protein